MGPSSSFAGETFSIRMISQKPAMKSLNQHSFKMPSVSDQRGDSQQAEHTGLTLQRQEPGEAERLSLLLPGMFKGLPTKQMPPTMETETEAMTEWVLKDAASSYFYTVFDRVLLTFASIWKLAKK